MKRFVLVVGVALLLVCAATPAEAGSPGWHLRLFGAWTDPGISETVPGDDGVDIRVSGTSELGFGGALEYQFNGRLGIEVGAASVSPGIRLVAEIPGVARLDLEDSLSTTVFTVDLNVHLTPEDSAGDFYLGGGFANVSFGNLSFQVPDDENLALNVGSDSTWSVKAGFDYSFGDGGWGLTLGLRYIDSALEATERGDDPGESESFDNELLVGTFGVVFNF